MKLIVKFNKTTKFILMTTTVALIIILIGFLLIPQSSKNLDYLYNQTKKNIDFVKTDIELKLSKFYSSDHLLKDEPKDNKKKLETQPNLLSNRHYLGHFPYRETDFNKLMLIGSYGQGKYQRFEYLDIEAGKALMKMIYAARDEGVWIVPVSGFRSIERQKMLFEDQIKMRGSVQEAAKVSAPPGYSEHHTGFAIDLADGKFPQMDVADIFEQTEAFQWLKNHAEEFGFEMSFSPENPQGVNYEPWHWRFTASPGAAKVFSSIRKLS
jgi:D-alanyl-D-alanine carboxypeptidase